jgi:beta-lactamase class A
MARQFSRVAAGAFALGVLSAVAWLEWRDSTVCASTHFVNEAAACGQLDASQQARFAVLEGELRTLLAQRRREGKLEAASVTLRALSGEPGFSIEGDAQFAPASLLKLPFAFVAFVMDEDEPGFLQHELAYTREGVVDYAIPAQSEVAQTGLVQGKRYTVEVLLQHVLAESDNLSYFLILQHLMAQPTGPAHFTRTLRELGVRDPDNSESAVASTREYASLFRHLYLASYLSVEASEQLLSWLGNAAFDTGIASGVPKGVAITNKFGERFSDDGSRQLHDCGIVYHETRPYVLCVLTRGTDFDALRGTLAEVSRRVYAAFDAEGR